MNQVQLNLKSVEFFGKVEYFLSKKPAQKNMKSATTESTSIFKLVFALIIFYLCSLGYGLFLFFGFFGYEDQAIFLSVLFFSGVFYFGYYRERNITKNNKNILNKLGTVVKTLLFFAFYH